MEDPSRTNPKRIKEISALKQKIKELEQSESERKRASEALRESEEYFKAIIQNSSDIILIVDRLGTITYTSSSIERFLGYGPDELIGKRSLDLIISDDKPKAIADFGRALLTKEVPIPDVFRIRHKNGTERILEGIGKNLLDNPIVAGFVMNVRDITDRKQVEEALRESEEKFRLLIENAPDAIYVHADARFIYLNHAAVNLFGAETADQLIGSSIMDRYDPDYHGMITKCLHDLYEERKKLPIVEQIYLRLDGSSVPVEAHAVPITYDDKNAALTFVRDITDRKRAEEVLQKSEERYRTLVENASDIVYRTDENGYFTFVNPAALRITGYEEQEIIGKHYKMFIRPDMFKEAITSFANQLIKKIPNTYSEYPVIMKDGREIWIGQNTQLIFQDGKLMAFQAVARDITDRRRIEEALRESEERYRTILENIEDGYFEVNITGNLTFFNDSVCRMVGYTRAELMGMSNRQYTDKENSQILYQAFNKVFRTGEPSKGVDYEIIGKETKLYIESSVSLIKNTSGQPIGFRGIMRNITERRRMEEALRDSEKRYRELSIVDDLTQLYNSRYFYHQLKMEMDRADRYGQPLTLLLLDLDDFKRFNDAYGHVEGDLVLFRLGQVVKRCLRQTDSAYRYGGEEFTILLPMTTSEDGTVTAERIRKEFKKENFAPVPGEQVHVTVSIGLAQYKTQEDMKAFVHRVDQLMYQGKKNGKDRLCCES